MREGSAGLSVRAVASHAGMSLGNLQHYFKTRDDLVTGIVVSASIDYGVRYQELFRSLPRSHIKKLEAVFNFLIEDIQKPETPSMFFAMWALGQHDEITRKVIHVMYAYHRTNLAILISEGNTEISESESSLRAAQIAAMIEGLIIYLSSPLTPARERKALADSAKKNALLLALAR